jgi:hypothetical protein
VVILSQCRPGAGLTEYTYDLAGNLTELLPANLRESGAGPIRYTYEYERLKDIEYPQNPENNVHYEYGKAGPRRSERHITVSGVLKVRKMRVEGRSFSTAPWAKW